ncbi:MAG: ABC transporter ATP-binding protein [Acidimicrobiia bacterium]|nr:ABC transporter ATP-binding protein [Acidimicrobiia bacterium]
MLNDPNEIPTLVVEDLCTSFATERGPLQAVDGVSFSLRRGHTLGVVGESGSGKSATARSIMNLLPPGTSATSGRVLLDGRDVRRLSRAASRHVWGVEAAMVFQNPMTSLNPVIPVGRQIGEGLRYHRKLSRAAAGRRARELLEQVGIADPERRLTEYPHQLSGGMRQRVMIAVALACDPKLLIADEPTTALDVTVQKQILDLLDRLRQQRRMAMILITHDLSVVAGRTDDVIVMYAGRVVEQAPTRQLFSAMRHPYTKALFESIPKVTQPSHTRLRIIEGRPPDLAALGPGCAFAPRCAHAQPRCCRETPRLSGSEGADARHACFYPAGTTAGEAALAANRAAGRTAAGLSLATGPAADAGTP